MARPRRIEGELADARLSIRFTSSERQALERVAEENRAPLAAVVREAVNTYVADYGEGQLLSPVSYHHVRRRSS